MRFEFSAVLSYTARVPKKAVAIYLLLALFGAILFVYFTFPRTKEEIPQSNNQRPYPSSPGPNGMPVPESVPHPNTPVVPHGPTLHVMAWANPAEAQALQAEADAFEATNGNPVALQVDGNAADYRRDLQQALLSGTPPDVCLIDARDFSGLVPERDLAPVTPPPGIAERSVEAFTIDDKTRAIPDEFSVDMLFYNPQHFDRAGIGYPGRHWTWDIMEAITRGLASLHLKTDSGESIYPLELPANFDFWNILCMQAGHPALDRDVWHLADSDGRESQLRGLDLIHEFFHELAVTAPAAKNGDAPGRFFAQQRASLLIAPSELAASLPNFPFQMTVLPSDLARANLARVNGWAVTARSPQPDAAAALARYLGAQPVHTGWSSVENPTDPTSNAGLCHEGLEQSLLPRIEPKTARLAQMLDDQINLFARNPQAPSSENLYAQIQREYLSQDGPAVETTAPSAVAPKAEVPQLRGL
jgi:ABC-type glycerol-3-phosphate transport system substrate-binding protein